MVSIQNTYNNNNNNIYLTAIGLLPGGSIMTLKQHQKQKGLKKQLLYTQLNPCYLCNYMSYGFYMGLA